jgi:7-cyano-7-deazaguanine synthase
VKAIVLFSGGLDSTTALYVACRDGKEPVCLSIRYGQLHEREISSAKKIAASLKLEHWIVPVSLPWGGSALIDGSRGDSPSRPYPPSRPYRAIPKGRSEAEISKEIPVTYVPARNSIFLSLAASLAETKGADTIYFGANALDYSGYPDCRPEFIEAFEEMITRGTKVGATRRVAPTEGPAIRIVAPLLRLSKSEIVKLGVELGVPFEWTWSCYEGGDMPCGECDSCLLRAKGFKEAGIEDPLVGARSPRPQGRGTPAPTI